MPFSVKVIVLMKCGKYHINVETFDGAVLFFKGLLFGFTTYFYSTQCAVD